MPVADSAEGAVASALFRSHVGQISRHSAVYFAGIIFTTGAGYFFKIYLARILGAHALGLFALGMTLVGLLGVFNGLGFSQAAVRFVASYSATAKWVELHGFLRQTFLILLGVNLVFAGGLVWLGPSLARRFYHEASLGPLMIFFAAIMFFGAINTYCGQVLAGYKDVSLRTVITNFIGSPLMISASILLLLTGAGLRGYLLAQVISAAVVFLLLAVSIWKLTPLPARSAQEKVSGLPREVIHFSAALFGVGILEFTLAQSDKILLGVLLDARRVGIYAVAGALITFVPVALQSVNQVFSPAIANLHTRGERDLLERLFQSLTRWVLALTIPLAVTFTFFSRPLMRLFGPEFELGSGALVLGTMGQLVNCGVGSVGFLLLMSGNQRRLIRVQAVMALVMIVLNLILIPRYGLLGAAAAAALTTAFANFWMLREVHLALGFLPYNRRYYSLIFPSLGTVGAVWLAERFASTVHPEWVAIVAAVALAYLTFATLILLGGLDSEDRMIGSAILYRVRNILPKGEQ